MPRTINVQDLEELLETEPCSREIWVRTASSPEGNLLRIWDIGWQDHPTKDNVEVLVLEVE